MATKKVTKITKATKKEKKVVKALPASKVVKKTKNKKPLIKLKEQISKPKFYDPLKLNESYVSLILGALVVVIISALIVFYLVGTNDSTNNQRVLNTSNSPTPKEEKNIYVIKEGESLWDVAVKYYGDGFSYIKIVEANKDTISNPDYVPPGTKIIIPNLNK